MHIISPTNNFDFSGVSLADQPSMVNDNVFIPLTYNRKPMYIQTPVGTTKSGIVCRPNSKHVDLLFDTALDATAEFNEWIKMLEHKCRSLVVDKSGTWFQHPLDTSDMDDSMMDIVKSFHSGRYYSLRSQIKSARTNQGDDARDEIIVYTEDKNLVSMTDITAESRVISILEIRGLQFSDKLVRFEIDVKQMMTLAPEPTHAPEPDSEPDLEPEPEPEPIDLFNTCQIETESETETSRVGVGGANGVVEPRATNLGLGSPDTPVWEDTDAANNNIPTDEFREEDYGSPPQSLALSAVPPSIMIEIDDAKRRVIELGEMPAARDDDAPTVPTPTSTLIPIIKNTDTDGDTDGDGDGDGDMVEVTATDLLGGDLSHPSLSLKPKRDIYYAMYRTAKKRSDVFKQEYLRALAESADIKHKYGLNDEEDGADETEDEIDP